MTGIYAGYTKSNSDVEPFTTCPSRVYATCTTNGGNYCAITKKNPGSGTPTNPINPTTGDPSDGGSSGGNPEEFDPTGSQLECGHLFDGNFGDIIRDTLSFMRFLVPVILIILTIIDYLKAIASQDQDQIKKATTTFIKRIIIGILVFVSTNCNILYFKYNGYW